MMMLVVVVVMMKMMMMIMIVIMMIWNKGRCPTCFCTSFLVLPLSKARSQGGAANVWLIYPMLKNFVSLLKFKVVLSLLDNILLVICQYFYSCPLL